MDSGLPINPMEIVAASFSSRKSEFSTISFNLFDALFAPINPTACIAARRDSRFSSFNPSTNISE